MMLLYFPTPTPPDLLPYQCKHPPPLSSGEWRASPDDDLLAKIANIPLEGLQKLFFIRISVGAFLFVVLSMERGDQILEVETPLR